MSIGFIPYLFEDPGVLEVVVHQTRDLRQTFVVQARHPPGLISMPQGQTSNTSRDKKSNKIETLVVHRSPLLSRLFEKKRTLKIKNGFSTAPWEARSPPVAIFVKSYWEKDKSKSGFSSAS